jgi:inorganic triphosphatase YgiF
MMGEFTFTRRACARVACGRSGGLPGGRAAARAGSSSLEVELKFQVPAPQRDAVLRAVATATARSQRLRAIYFETTDQRLAAAGLALRLRKEGRLWVQALKGCGDGVASRHEHEVPLPPQRGTPTIDPQRHAATPVGRLLSDALRGEPELLPLYTTDVQRVRRLVRHAGSVIEIAYDRGHINAGPRSVVVDEIEFELVSGAPAALAALAQRWVERHGLWWDARTKSERGLRLALQRQQVHAVHASPPEWPADATPAAVWQSALRSALAQALPNAAEIASGAGAPEHLHQLRVALRRLRTALRVLAPWGGQAEAAHALDAAWRGPFGALGAARDADILAQTLRPQLQAAGAPPHGWPAAVAAADPGETVRSRAFNTLLLRTLALALDPASLAAAEAPALPEAARQLLRPAWRKLMHDAEGYAQAAAAQQHRARRRLKRLRYTIDVLMPLFKRKPARRLNAALRRALDALGELNDLQVAEGLCRAQAAVDAPAWFAVGWLAARRERALDAAVHRLSQLAQAPRVWNAR